MCLVVLKNRPKQIAQEDIIVYKKINIKENNILCSPHQGFLYELNKLYTTEIGIRPSGSLDPIFSDSLDGCFVEAYFIKRNMPLTEKLIYKYFDIYDVGFHSYCTFERANVDRFNNDGIFKCTIPKNSEYIEGVTDLLVSNQIIVNEEVEE